ncbi:MAG: Unknown protein [uncultured Campylobacterales bacterium]|uniref:Uncharacterized protein n=1 Tax=uncultured Campylobacterales bacterium TaxID=352960 RepID=A0A6S6S8Z0_9BACT|nr:MAG: Unknown protein [uncultured Campylobacterales bacterium]
MQNILKTWVYEMKNIFLLMMIFLFNIGCLHESYIKPGTIQSQYARGFYVELLMLPDELKGIKLPRGTKFYKFTRENRDIFIKKYYIAKKPHDEIPKKDMWIIKDNKKYFYVLSDNNNFIKNINTNGIVKVPIKECYKNGFCKLYPVSDFYKATLYIERDNIYQSDKDVTWLDKLDESK